MEIAGRSLDIVQTPPEREGAPTLVFLHEGLGSVALWRDFPKRIAGRTGCGSVVYSRYGNGFSEILASPRDVNYMHDEALIVLPELLRDLGVRRPLLVGHSDGASIALIFASAFPDAVRGLVLEAPHVMVEDLSVASIASIGERYRTTDLREKMARYHADVDATFFGWNDIWLSPAFRSWSIVDRLPAILAPALAIQGADDQYGTLAQLDLLSERVAAPVDRIVLAGCGHAPHRERPAFVEGAIVEWLTDRGMLS